VIHVWLARRYADRRDLGDPLGGVGDVPAEAAGSDDYSRRMHVRNREKDAQPFVTKDGSTIREYLHTARQSLAEATLEPGTSTTRHYHARAEEIYLFVEGDGALEVDGETRDVGPGDAALIPPGAWHQLTAGPEGARLLCCCVPAYSDDDTFFA
jgi:mannose-6-phosphate isomerase-like protein (cupin superfamily)